MSKPPFRIPTRAGIQLWPRTIQLPTATSYTFEGEGDTADERAAAIEYARRNCEENDGKIKQFYLRVRTAVEVSNMTYFKQSCKIAPGITASFLSNYGNEVLQIHSSARATITVQEPQKPLQNFGDVFAFVFYGWNTGRDLDTLSAIIDPPRSKYIGWAGNRGNSTGLYGPAVAYNLITYKDKAVMSWLSGDNTSGIGPEVLFVDPMPLIKRDYPSMTIELNANWYAELGSTVDLVVQLFGNPDNTPVPTAGLSRASPAVVRAQMLRSGMTFLDQQEFTKVITLYAQGVPTQRVGYITITRQAVATGSGSTPAQGYRLTVERENGTIITSPS